MKRDDDLIRRLLFEAEASTSRTMGFKGLSVISPTAEDTKRAHHAQLLCDAGYFAQETKSSFRLTNAGHDWLQAVRDDTVWNKTKQAAGDAGGVGLKLLGSIAEGYMRQKLTELGIPLA